MQAYQHSLAGEVADEAGHQLPITGIPCWCWYAGQQHPITSIPAPKHQLCWSMLVCPAWESLQILQLPPPLTWLLFLPKWLHFALPEHTPKFTKPGVYVTPAEKCHYLLSSSISTSRWNYNQGKCILAYNSHILCRIFKNLISTRWIVLNLVIYATSISGPGFFPAYLRNGANLLFQVLPGHFTNFHHTYAHSICGPFWQKVIKKFWYCKQ